MSGTHLIASLTGVVSVDYHFLKWDQFLIVDETGKIVRLQALIAKVVIHVST